MFFQDQMGGSKMSAEPDSGDHLYAAAKAELNTDAAAVTLDSGRQIFFFYAMINSNCSGISYAFTSPSYETHVFNRSWNDERLFHCDKIQPSF